MNIKKVYSILIISTIFFSCDFEYIINEVYDYLLLAKASNHELYYIPECEMFETLDDIDNFICDNVIYKSDPEDNDTWENPEVTLNRGYGDCEDLIILFMNLAYYSLDIESEIVLVELARTVEGGGSINHARIRIADVVYKLPGLSVSIYPVNYSFTFWEVFKKKY